MTFLKPMALGAAVVVLAGGSAFAQSPMATHDSVMSDMPKHDTPRPSRNGSNGTASFRA